MEDNTFNVDQKMDQSLYETLADERSLELPAWLMQDDLATKLPRLPASRLYHNLPPRFQGALVRQMELVRIRGGLRSSHSFLAIEGAGGIGKTTFALEVAYQALRGSDLIPCLLFDAAVWISASGRWNRGYWLSEVLNTIACVLDHRPVAQLSLSEKRSKVNELLRTHQTLVIIDDFDTIDDEDLLSWIQHIPEPSKVLVIGRDVHRFHPAWTLHLEGLTQDDAPELINYYTQKLHLAALENAQINDVCSITHGNPQAIAMILGNLKYSGLSLRQILDELHNAGDTLDRLLVKSWDILENLPGGQQVLLAASFFEGSASGAALGKIAEIDDARLGEILTRLEELSLIEVYHNKRKKSAYYGLQPLIRAFTDTKLKERLDWEQEACERWIGWWLEFTKVHGGPDRMEWAENYSLINEERVNLSLVCEWCAAHNRYEVLQALWHSERLLWMTSVYGCWKLRLTWLRQIGKDAEARGDRAIALEAMVEQGFTLTQMGRVDEAGKMLKGVWRQNHLLSLEVQATLAENLMQWHMRINDFAGAQYWLKRADQLVRKLSEPKPSRHALTVQYYSGVMCIAKGDKQQAEMFFQKTLKEAQDIGWQRCMIYIKQFLDEIAKAPSAMFGDAEHLPQTGTKMVNKDKRSIASSKSSLAYLALCQLRRKNKEKELNKVIHWAQQALDSFEPLPVQPEAMEYLDVAPSAPSVVCFVQE